jgi:hypothetical protein
VRTNSAVDSEESAGAPEAEIEVTPEMVSAGSLAVEKFYIGDGRYVLAEDAMVAVYRAMTAAKFLPPATEHRTRC